MPVAKPTPPAARSCTSLPQTAAGGRFLTATSAVRIALRSASSGVNAAGIRGACRPGEPMRTMPPHSCAVGPMSCRRRAVRRSSEPRGDDAGVQSACRAAASPRPGSAWPLCGSLSGVFARCVATHSTEAFPCTNRGRPMPAVLPSPPSVSPNFVSQNDESNGEAAVCNRPVSPPTCDPNRGAHRAYGTTCATPSMFPSLSRNHAARSPAPLLG